MTLTKKTLLLALMTAAALGGNASLAATTSDQELAVQALINHYPFLKKRFDGTRAGLKNDYPVILIETERNTFIRDIKFNDPAIVVMTEAEIVAHQIATFVSIAEISIEGNTARVSYNIPSSARFGTLTLTRGDAGWQVSENKEMRSSSAARNFYGRLYELATCRDDTEMAFR